MGWASASPSFLAGWWARYGGPRLVWPWEMTVTRLKAVLLCCHFTTCLWPFCLYLFVVAAEGSAQGCGRALPQSYHPARCVSVFCVVVVEYTVVASSEAASIGF